MYKIVSRYLDEDRFNWLLSDKGLYLSAAADQSDPFEGTYDYTFLSRHIRDVQVDVDEGLLSGLDSISQSLMENGRTSSFISSWYLGDEESHDMWEVFGRGGAIIVSTEWGLGNLLPEPLEQATAFYNVIYSDKLKLEANHEPLRVIHEQFKNEKEFRIVFDLTRYSVLTGFEARPETTVYHGDQPSYKSEAITCCMSKLGIAQSHKVIRKKGRGYVIEYPLNSIIREVRLHPCASDTDVKLTEERLKAIGIDCVVRHSSLRS